MKKPPSLTVASNNVTKMKPAEEKTAEEFKLFLNESVSEKIIEFIHELKSKELVEGAIVMIKTNDDDIRSISLNVSGDEIISTVEEFKQRYYFSKFMENL